jgi:hypothetical protein
MDVLLVCKDRTVPQLSVGDFLDSAQRRSKEWLAVSAVIIQAVQDNSGVGVVSSSGMHPTRKLVRASISEWK